jgi:hypothetical protein
MTSTPACCKGGVYRAVPEIGGHKFHNQVLAEQQVNPLNHRARTGVAIRLRHIVVNDESDAAMFCSISSFS